MPKKLENPISKFLCDVEDRFKLGRDKANLIIGLLTISNTLLLLNVIHTAEDIIFLVVGGSLGLILFGVVLHSSGYAGQAYGIIIERCPFFQEMEARQLKILKQQERIITKLDLK